MMDDIALLPTEILEHIARTVEKEYEYRDEVLHVTELLYCLRKAFYRRKVPEEAQKRIEQYWYVYRGNVFDELWCKLFERNQVRVTHRIPNGPTIVGRIDFVRTENGEPVIYELKTVSSHYAIKDGPKPHHVAQVKAYAWMENIKRAKLIYVSFEGVKVFDIDCSDAESVVLWLEGRAMKLYRSLKENKPPEREEGWECRYCEFKDICGGREG
jgi:CRISPR-associated protein Cas4